MANHQRRQPSSQDDVNNPPPPVATTEHPVYHGIRCRSGKWVSEIREPNKSTRIWLGTYPTPEMAAAAYDVAAYALKGAYAILNFPNSDISTLLPENPTADDIRAAAARAAAARAPGGGRSSSSAASQAEAAAAAAGEFMDDEAVFRMPSMISDMAEGMLLSPPRINTTSTPPPNYYGDNYNSFGGSGNLWDY